MVWFFHPSPLFFIYSFSLRGNIVGFYLFTLHHDPLLIFIYFCLFLCINISGLIYLFLAYVLFLYSFIAFIVPEIGNANTIYYHEAKYIIVNWYASMDTHLLTYLTLCERCMQPFAYIFVLIPLPTRHHHHSSFLYCAPYPAYFPSIDRILSSLYIFLNTTTNISPLTFPTISTFLYLDIYQFDTLVCLWAKQTFDARLSWGQCQRGCSFVIVRYVGGLSEWIWLRIWGEMLLFIAQMLRLLVSSLKPLAKT